jgi:hypothetical protein
MRPFENRLRSFWRRCFKTRSYLMHHWASDWTLCIIFLLKLLLRLLLKRINIALIRFMIWGKSVVVS